MSLMKIEFGRYVKARNISLPKMAEEVSDLLQREVSSKTLWNWANHRYDFRVVVEVPDTNFNKIDRLYKEIPIL